MLPCDPLSIGVDTGLIEASGSGDRHLQHKDRPRNSWQSIGTIAPDVSVSNFANSGDYINSFIGDIL
jgi:hypothetical protein